MTSTLCGVSSEGAPWRGCTAFPERPASPYTAKLGSPETETYKGCTQMGAYGGPAFRDPDYDAGPRFPT